MIAFNSSTVVRLIFIIVKQFELKIKADEL